MDKLPTPDRYMASSLPSQKVPLEEIGPEWLGCLFLTTATGGGQDDAKEGFPCMVGLILQGSFLVFSLLFSLSCSRTTAEVIFVNNIFKT